MQTMQVKSGMAQIRYCLVCTYCCLEAAVIFKTIKWD